MLYSDSSLNTVSDDDESLAFKHHSFKNKSTFDPKHVQRGHLDSYINTVRYDLAKQPIQTPKNKNLNTEEYQTLKDLKPNIDITIQKIR